jgi:hypothetical protein
MQRRALAEKDLKTDQTNFPKHYPRQRAELAGGLALGFAGRLTRLHLGRRLGFLAAGV